MPRLGNQVQYLRRERSVPVSKGSITFLVQVRLALFGMTEILDDGVWINY